jgi:hypothetical protein
VKLLFNFFVNGYPSLLLEGDESCRHVIVGHGSSTTHKDVRDIDLIGWYIQGCGTLATYMLEDDIFMANNFLKYLFFNLFLE